MTALFLVVVAGSWLVVAGLVTAGWMFAGCRLRRVRPVVCLSDAEVAARFDDLVATGGLR